jgi:hypothetical protein
MKIQNAKLLKSFEAINNNLLRLVVELVTLRESVAAAFAAVAHHNAKVLRQLSDVIWS